MYVIEARYVADSQRGLVSQKGIVLKFISEEKAREFGKENIEKSRYVASWEAISKTEATQRGHHID